uniref:Putative group i salivary lipocalin n=1 Tax=Rhipicephalus pulchellus TaxID=72859 RepID=L7MBW9_RHIPC
MTGTLKITVLALVLTTARKLCNAADTDGPTPPGCATETTTNNTFQLFWKNRTKVWTVNSTVMFYNCEWEEANITKTGLAAITHFGTYNMIKFNWTFHKSDMMLCKRTDGEIKRRMVYQSENCAVFVDQIRRRDNTSTTTARPKFSGRQYRLVVDDKNKTEMIPRGCQEKYDRATRRSESYIIYHEGCK